MRDIRGEKNPRWNGGNSEYPDHVLLKRIRIEMFMKHKGKCQICGGRATQVHHIDESKSCHEEKNLLLLCRKCHNAIHGIDDLHRKKPQPSKYRRMFGYTLAEISGITGYSYTQLTKILNRRDSDERKQYVLKLLDEEKNKSNSV